jgi:hypothetical protein
LLGIDKSAVVLNDQVGIVFFKAFDQSSYRGILRDAFLETVHCDFDIVISQARDLYA